LTLVGLIIRFGATYLASALGHATLCVVIWKRLYEAEKIWPTAQTDFLNRIGQEEANERGPMLFESLPDAQPAILFRQSTVYNDGCR